MYCDSSNKGKNEEYEDHVLDEFKSTGKKRVLCVAKVDGVPEIRHNIKLLLD